jgi:hypothetical protein
MNQVKKSKEIKKIELGYNLDTWIHLDSVKNSNPKNNDNSEFHFYIRGYFYDFSWVWDAKCICQKYVPVGFSRCQADMKEAIEHSFQSFLHQADLTGSITVIKQKSLLEDCTNGLLCRKTSQIEIRILVDDDKSEKDTIENKNDDEIMLDSAKMPRSAKCFTIPSFSFMNLLFGQTKRKL